MTVVTHRSFTNTDKKTKCFIVKLVNNRRRMDFWNCSFIILIIIICLLPFIDLSKVFSQFDQIQIDRGMTNFTELFEDEFTSEEVCGLDFCSLYLDIEYQSSYTIVLEGKLLRLTEDTIGYTTNDLIWKGVDVLKEAGYIIDSIQLSGFGTETNPYTYHIIMSRAVNSTHTTE
jgi:hypothetical protein